MKVIVILAALPLGAIAQGCRAPSAQAVSTTLETVTVISAASSMVPTTQESITTAPHPTPVYQFTKTGGKCDVQWCTNGHLICLYWGGFTSWDDIGRRPIPGEIYTTLGDCYDRRA